MSLFKNVNVVSINVANWEAAKKFYGEILDWPVAWADDEFGWVEYGRENETHISLNRWQDRDGHTRPPALGGTTLILSVDDAHTTTDALRAKGVKCDDVVVIPGVVAYGQFYDPEGNRIQFTSSAPPAIPA